MSATALAADGRMPAFSDTRMRGTDTNSVETETTLEPSTKHKHHQAERIFNEAGRGRG